MRSLLMGVALSLLAGAAGAVQIVLSPSAAIGSSGSYSPDFPAGDIFDQQVGGVADISRQTYWLNADNTGSIPIFITIDLGAAYNLERLTLFNTHNGPWNDRGTGAFRVMGANSVTDLGGGNFRVSGSLTTLVEAVLPAANTVVPAANNFPLSLPGSFRYLSFEPTSVAAAGVPASATAYGLNEFRVFVTEVPEPGTAAFMLVGAAFVGWTAVRKRSRERILDTSPL